MLEVLEAGGIATIQDLGRTGWRRYGVPHSGPMDVPAFVAANLLVGNAPDRAGIETGAGDLELLAHEDCVIAAAGAGYSLSVYTWTFPLWDSCLVRAGWTIRLKRNGSGMWAYLAVAGGVEVPAALHSRSTYLRGRLGGLGGRLLQSGDALKIGSERRALADLAARTLIEPARPAYAALPVLEVIPGPQEAAFDRGSLSTFLSSSYRISATSDRMGYRLEGASLTSRIGAELISEGLDSGCIQVPSDGQPMVMMADCATTGGYPKIASVIRADLPLLAQCTPGRDSVRFRRTTVESAQAKYRAMLERIRQGIVDSDEESGT